jgi:hypothetical protein
VRVLHPSERKGLKVIDNLLPLLFALAVICVGALALGFIADGLGKFRAPIRKVEESFDKPNLYVVPNPIPHLREVTEVYDQEKDPDPYEKY